MYINCVILENGCIVIQKTYNLKNTNQMFFIFVKFVFSIYMYENDVNDYLCLFAVEIKYF